MAHFAQLDENNRVLQVIVVSNDDCGRGDFPESEPVGIGFLESLGLFGVWKQTSYHSNFRGYFAGIGSFYISEADVFTHPQPYPSWVLDSNYDWQPPVAKPDQDGFWYWDESEQQWVR